MRSVELQLCSLERIEGQAFCAATVTAQTYKQLYIPIINLLYIHTLRCYIFGPYVLNFLEWVHIYMSGM